MHFKFSVCEVGNTTCYYFVYYYNSITYFSLMVFVKFTKNYRYYYEHKTV